MKEILKDTRKILKLIYPNSEYWAVGSHGITAIEPYEETGETDVLWFRIRKGKSLHARVQAKYVMEVIYTIPKPRKKLTRRTKKEVSH